MKIAVLVSGGVDSSVALKLLKEQGHELTAFYLKIWLEDELSYLGDCPWEEDLAFVRQVCDKEGIPLEVVSLQKEYWEHVVSYALAEVKAGRTPNPDILCNSRIKFGFFMNYLDSLSPLIPSEFSEGKLVSRDYVASGHYAQVSHQNGASHLLRCPDPVKDQTYFLSYLSQEQLSRCLFPIGHLAKPEVRELAHTFDLPNKDRKDSQGLCFLGKISFADFIKHYLGSRKGDLIEVETGKKMGHHDGFWYYTIGQRQGIGLSGGPWYVVAKDPAANTVFISRNYYDPAKVRNEFAVADCNWLQGMPPVKTALEVKLRHGKQLHAATVDILSPTSCSVKLQSNDQGIAPGQFAVFYDGQECLGAGIIE